MLIKTKHNQEKGVVELEYTDHFGKIKTEEIEFRILAKMTLTKEESRKLLITIRKLVGDNNKGGK